MKGARFIGAYTTSLADLICVGETANKRLYAKNGTVLKNGSIIINATVVGDDAAVAAVKDAAKAHLTAVAKARSCVLSVNLLAPASLACLALVEACELGNEIKIEEAPGIGSDEFFAPKSSGPPLLNDSGFKVGGPHAIMRYICQRFHHVMPNWYPADLQARARVDEVLENHSCRGRQGSPWYYYKYVATTKNEAAATEAIAHCRRNLLALEERLSRQNFVAGDQMSIADLACYTELGALRLSSIFESYMAEHKLLNVVRWCKAMAAQPWHDKVVGLMHAKLLGEAGQHK
jgi:glutathione S-transferase